MTDLNPFVKLCVNWIEPTELRFAEINETEIVQLNHLISVQINMMTTDALNGE